MSEYYGISVRGKLKLKVVSVKYYTEEERTRLLKEKKRCPAWWNNPGRSDWARDRFGETLTEKDGLQTYEGASARPIKFICDCCGKILTHKYGAFMNLEFIDSKKAEQELCIDVCRKCFSAFLGGAIEECRKELGEKED